LAQHALALVDRALEQLPLASTRPCAMRRTSAATTTQTIATATMAPIGITMRKRALSQLACCRFSSG
jgi:hypothetical protein